MYNKYLDLAKQFISFKSISTDTAFKDEIEKTANWLENLFRTFNFKTKIFRGYGNPIVYASFVVDPNFETVLIYGHYDVQPAKKEDGWDSDPFSLIQRDERLFARGIVDNKGQVLIHIITILELIKSKSLKYNVKFLIEGDEETGGTGISKLLQEKSDTFKSDIVLVSDGEIPYKPMITVSFRGLIETTMRLKTANNNLHSGLFGGAVPNASEEASKIVARLTNENYLSNISNFYDGLISPSSEEIDKGKMMDEIKAKFLKTLGVKKFFKGKRASLTERIGFDTMITVTGFKSGYIGDGYSNIIPNFAEVKFNGRIGHGHRAKDILEKFEKFILSSVPDYVEIKFVDNETMADPIKIDISTEQAQETIKLLEKVYKSEVLFDFCGAIVPVVGDFQKYLNVEPLVISLGNEDCNMHGVDENFHIDLIKKGLEFSRKFFEK